MTTQGSRLKKLRQALDLSQEALGARLDVSKQYISNLEADRNVLNNEKLVSLLVDFNVNLNWLIGGCGEMFNNYTQESFCISSKSVLRAEVLQILKEQGLIK